jgi:hypothetical protein
MKPGAIKGRAVISSNGVTSQMQCRVCGMADAFTSGTFEDAILAQQAWVNKHWTEKHGDDRRKEGVE